jgi:hypothetical protein
MVRLLRYVRAKIRAYYLWQFWKIHYLKRLVRQSSLAPDFALGDYNGWPQNLSFREMQKRSWPDRQTWAAVKPYNDRMASLTKSYLMADRFLRKLEAKFNG